MLIHDVATPKAPLPAFALSCWLLGLMGFSQVLVAGMALAARLESSREPKIVIKEVVKYVQPQPRDLPAQRELPEYAARPILPPPIDSQPLPPPTSVSTPQIADPISERLVKEARTARVAGDNMQAIVKLEEALTKSPEDPSVHYELGLIHEQMGVFDKASAYFERVFKMGVSGAGSLYEAAAGKLRDGYIPETTVGKLSLGRVRIFNDPQNAAGKLTILTIPVQKAPDEEIDINEMRVEVLFFNRTNRGDIIELEDVNKSWVTDKWISGAFDWVGGEETLRMTYVIPPQDQQAEHLFGECSYHGQVVKLFYKGEVLDVQAWPRDLIAKIPNGSASNPVPPEYQDTLPPDFDPSVPLLPALPSN